MTVAELFEALYSAQQEITSLDCIAYDGSLVNLASRRVKGYCGYHYNLRDTLMVAGFHGADYRIDGTCGDLYDEDGYISEEDYDNSKDIAAVPSMGVYNKNVPVLLEMALCKVLNHDIDAMEFCRKVYEPNTVVEATLKQLREKGTENAG